MWHNNILFARNEDTFILHVFHKFTVYNVFNKYVQLLVNDTLPETTHTQHGHCWLYIYIGWRSETLVGGRFMTSHNNTLFDSSLLTFLVTLAPNVGQQLWKMSFVLDDLWLKMLQYDGCKPMLWSTWRPQALTSHSDITQSTHTASSGAPEDRNITNEPPHHHHNIHIILIYRDGS